MKNKIIHSTLKKNLRETKRFKLQPAVSSHLCTVHSLFPEPWDVKKQTRLLRGRDASDLHQS